MSMSHLVLLIEQGITEEDENYPGIAPFWPIRYFLDTHDGVYKDNVVVLPFCGTIYCNIFMPPTINHFPNITKIPDIMNIHERIRFPTNIYFISCFHV